MLEVFSKGSKISLTVVGVYNEGTHHADTEFTQNTYRLFIALDRVLLLQSFESLLGEGLEADEHGLQAYICPFFKQIRVL